MKIAIIGAGLTGLAAAYQLVGRGCHVTVFEAAPEVGGLARGFNPGDGDALERYYHHIFTHDAVFLRYAQDLGVKSQLDWLPSRMGTYAHGALYPFMTPMDLLRFPHLSVAQRLRFGLATLYARGIRCYEPLESETAEAWLVRLFGVAGYREVWQPLLTKKFERHTADVAAVWMWGKIALRGSSREKGQEKESLGYMRGGFQVFHEALAEGVRVRGGTIRLGTPVTGLERQPPATSGEAGGEGVTGGPGLSSWVITTATGACGDFDQVLVTLPPHPMRHLIASVADADTLNRLDKLAFQGALVAVLKLDRPLTPYYWINVNAMDVPFGGVIEHTNMLPPARYGGSHIVYLSRYIDPDDGLFKADDQAVLDTFLPHLAHFNPTFEATWLEQCWVFRDAFAQPVVPVGYRDHMPPLQTGTPGLFLANMSHIFPEDRGMNYALTLGERVSTLMGNQQAS